MKIDVDAAHVEAPLAPDQGESSWACAELDGTSDGRARRLAMLVWLHRTGPRLGRLDAGPGVLDHRYLPAALREIVPSWLPIVTPVTVRTDDRPLLLVVLYDLDRPEAEPRRIEQAIEAADFAPTTFSGRTPNLSLQIQAGRLLVMARTPSFAVELEGTPTKPAVSFGDGSPTLRHGPIEIGYLQRPRVEFRGSIVLDRETIEVRGEGAHDRHWRRSSPPNLAWLWLHLRLDGGREVNCYVLRDARAPSRVIAARGWWIASDAGVGELADFTLEAEGDHYVFRAEELGVGIRFVHAVRHAYLPLGAFGEAIDAGISEAPIRVVDGDPEQKLGGWLEIFDSANASVRSGSPSPQPPTWDRSRHR